MMSFRSMMLVVVVGALAVPVGALAQNASPHGQRHTVSDRTAAAAALLPVEEGSQSWGRVMVADRSYSEGSMRDLVCHLVEMDGEVDYILMIDGIEVGLITTDLEGEGWLHLQTPERNYPELPENLPAVANLSQAWILDGTHARVLEGSLVDMPSPPVGASQLVYLEKARLISDLDDSRVRGQARVARDVDDIQYFQCVGIAVAPSSAFRVEVDGLLAGVVTSNAGGVAELKLSTGDFGDVLPDPLLPIEDLRLVEWFSQNDGSLVMSGTFVGMNQMGLGGSMGGGQGHGGDFGDCEGSDDAGYGDGDCDGDCDGTGGDGDHGDHGGGTGDGDCDGTGDGDPDGDGGDGGHGGGSGGHGGGDGGHGGGSGDGDCDGTGGGTP